MKNSLYLQNKNTKSGTYLSLGYIRALKKNTKTFIKALVDSGNLFGDIMSEKLAKILKLQIKPCNSKAGTAVSNQKVHVLGKVDPFELILEGLQDPIVISPFIIRNLSHDLNLGESFLRKYKAELKFEGSKVTLNVNGQKLELVNRNTPLIRNSNDERFIKIMAHDKIKRTQSINESQPNNGIIIETIGFAASTAKKVIIKKNSLSFLAVNSKIETEIGYFQSKENSHFLNSNNLLLLNGLIKCSKEITLIPCLNLGDKDVKIPSKVRIGKIYRCSYAKLSEINTLNHKQVSELSKAEIQERRRFLKEELNVKDMIVGKEVQEQVIDLFMKYFDAVSISPDDFGSSSLIQFHITLLPGANPIRSKCRPLNPIQEQDLDRQLKEWLSAGVIEPSVSPWAAALVPCKKKGTDKLRWSCDFRGVNKLTVKDGYPLPNIESNLHKLAGAKVFSSLDSAGAFHSLSISPESRDYTTFTSPFGTFRFKRMPFGLSNSPSAYCRLVQLALERLPPGFAVAYLDDILIYSNDEKDHLYHLGEILRIHAEVGMKVNIKKCKIFRSKVTYLGHNVSHKGVEMVEEYVDKIKAWPIPKTGKELISFLGFTSYYRAFIPQYAEVVAPLNKYRNEKSLELNPDEIKRIDKLKELFLVKPVRAYPDYNSPEPFILDTDFSGVAAGGVLSQTQGGNERFIGCFSKSLDAAQSKYPAHKGELLAVILGLRKFEHILRARKFLIRTDSSAITFIQGLKEARGIFARWLIYLSSFDFDIIHRPGKTNKAADALSRTLMPQNDQDKENPDDYLVFPDIDDVYHVDNVWINADQTCMTGDRLNTWIMETKKDYPLHLTIEYVKKGKMPDLDERKNLPPVTNLYLKWFPLLYIKDELLYINKPKGEVKTPRVCVPRTLQKDLIKVAHQGHRGISETLEKIRTRAFFPNMNELVSLMINNCVSCLQKSNAIPNTKESIQHHELLSYPMQRVYLDTVGPLTPCKYRGLTCKHILTILDGFSRYFVAIPLPDLEAKTILEALVNKFILVHGVPECIHTDNGSSLMSHLFQDSCKQMNIKMTQTPVYSPQGNRVERSHRTLGQILRSDDTFVPGSWVQKLDSAVFEINISRNRITGVAPYYALFGRNPRIPLDVFFPDNRLQKALKWTDYVSNLSNKMDNIHNTIIKHETLNIPVLTEIKAPRSKYQISVGNIVFYMSPKGILNLSKKLTLRWTGPYRVIETPSESLSVIYPVGNWALNKRELHVLTSRLKKVDPEYSNLVGEQVDLELILQREDDEEDIRFPTEKGKSVSNTDIPRDIDTTDSDSSADEVEVIKTNIVNPEIIINDNIREGTQNPPNNPIISQEYAKPNSLIKDEVITNDAITQSEQSVPEETPVNRAKRVYTRRYQAPREQGIRRDAFDSARQKLADSLKRRKNK